MTLLRFPKRDLAVHVDDQSRGTSGLPLAGDSFLMVGDRLCQGARRRFLSLPPHSCATVTVSRSRTVCQSVRIEAGGVESYHLLPRYGPAVSLEDGIRSILDALSEVVRGQASILRALESLCQTSARRE